MKTGLEIVESPLVSIGIPNYNYSRFICKTLESVVTQDYQNIEVIIVDDLSTDNSIEVIEDWMRNYDGSLKIRLFKNEENSGLTKVCNQILRYAEGKYFQPLDADDNILQAKIKRQVQLLEGDKEASMIYGNAAVINEEGEVTEDDYLARIKYDKSNMPEGYILDELLKFNFISMPTVLLSVEKVRQVGGFDETLQVQDYYLWLKLAEQGKILFQNEIVAQYRLHKNSMSNNSSTNPKFEDSVLQLKYRYYNSSSEEIKEIIKTNIQNSAVYLYEQGYVTAKKWMRIALKLRPTLKIFFYNLNIHIGMPFSIVSKIKSLAARKKL